MRLIQLILFTTTLLFTACNLSESTGCDDNSSIVPPFVPPTCSDPNYFTPGYDISQEASKENRMLVIQLDYRNQHFINGENSWSDKIFGTNNHQLNHYMRSVSQGNFTYSPVAEGGGDNNGVLSVCFDTDHPDPNVDIGSQFHPDLSDAIRNVSSLGFDFSIYDTNRDGRITPDELLVVFIMAGEEDAYNGGSSRNGIWAHEYCTEPQYTPVVNGVSVMGCASTPTEADGSYAIFGERHRDFSDDHDATIGIIAHELGHAALRLPDLYDVFGRSAGIGGFGLMSTGSWGQATNSEYPGATPTHLSAWSKIDVGWVQPEVKSSINNSLVNLYGTNESNYNIVKIPINNHEYFLLENRSRDGYDSGLTTLLEGTYQGGLAIWHIDDDTIAQKRDDNEVNADVRHKGVDLEEANDPRMDNSSNNFGHANNLFFSTNKSEFTPTTVPNTNSYTTSSGIYIENISAVSTQMHASITNPN